MDSHQPLMKEWLDDDPNAQYQSSQVQPCHRKKHNWLPFMLHIGLVLIYTTVFVVLTPKAPVIHYSDRELIHSPARGAIEYETRVFHSPVSGNPFAGPPREELDKAWHGLLKNIHIRISKSDVDKIKDTTLALADGSGYVGSLEVYHDLHCLKRIRHFIYKETYLSNMTKEEFDFQLFHTEHCLEHFRELVMCRGDVALTTFYYRRHEVTAKLLAEHECINWHKLEKWVEERAIDLSIPGIVESEHII